MQSTHSHLPAEHEKAAQIQDIYKKARREDKVKVKYVVSSKSGAARVKKTTNTRVRLVDKRMKKGQRATKARAKRNK